MVDGDIQPKRIGPGEAVCDEGCPCYQEAEVGTTDARKICTVDLRTTHHGGTCRAWEYCKAQILNRGYEFGYHD